jgi:hypothetical protein
MILRRKSRLLNQAPFAARFIAQLVPLLLAVRLRSIARATTQGLLRLLESCSGAAQVAQTA